MAEQKLMEDSNYLKRLFLPPVKFDATLIAIGRELNTDRLDLEKAGVKLNRYDLFFKKPYY